MKGLDILETEQWSLAPLIGYKHPFLAVNISTIVHTWIILGLLVLTLIPIRWVLKSRFGCYIVTSFVSFFIDLTTQSLEKFSFTHFSFIASIFTFILACNTASIIPWIEEPTKDLNTTLALGLISFLYTQIASIQKRGFIAYIKDYFEPFFIMFPLNLVGKIASIVSISFRLFGNIFGGSIISQIYFSAIGGSLFLETIGIISGINVAIMIFFTLFEGFLQAFVFAMLTLTYLSIGLQEEGN